MLDDNIPAIPSYFNGVRYRSRLEKKVAQFLTEGGITFHYESPLCVAVGKTFVPDFWLPALDLYLEVKPRRFFEELRSHEVTLRASGARLLVVDSENRGELDAYADFNLLQHGAFSEGPGILSIEPGSPNRDGLCLHAGKWVFRPRSSPPPPLAAISRFIDRFFPPRR